MNGPNHARIDTYRTLFECIGDAIVVTDVERVIREVNPAFTTIFGYSAAEVVGSSTRVLFATDEGFRAFGVFLESAEARSSFLRALEVRRKSGEAFPADIGTFPLADASGQITGRVSLVRDATNRRMSEEELAKKELYSRSLIEHSLDITAVIEAGGRIRYITPSVERILGYTAAELEGKEILDLIDPDDREKAASRFRLSLETGARFEHVEFRMRHRDGAWRSLSFVGKTLPPETGITGLIVSARDLTDRQQLEEQLRVSQKMEGIGRLAGGIAHDFNNLLTAILGYSDLLESDLPDDEGMRTSLHEIRRAGERAAALTRQLLAFSRKQVLQPRVLDLNTIVADLEKMLRRMIGEDVELVTRLEPALGSVKADPGQLEQVLMNLAVNSRDAMPDGGTLTIETSNVVLDADFVATHPGSRAGTYSVLAVLDSGAGMTQDVRDHVFEPFFTTKEKGKGTGLGLATAYGIVKQSEGYITVESQPGRGTQFRIYLPKSSGPGDYAGRPPLSSLSPTGTETILLVEDEAGVRRLSRAILETQGYRVLEAESGEQALAAARGHTGPIHLVATDVVMPGMSGRILWDRLRGTRPESRVLFVSGYTDDAIVRHGVLDPGTAFLQKPFTPHSLAQKVREVLDAPPGPGPSA